MLPKGEGVRMRERRYQPSPKNAADFWARFERSEEGCLEWTGGHSNMGYGAVLWEGKVWRVHRLAWTLAMGPIPDGMLVCHHCDNTNCSEPAHLFLGTQQDNVIDSFAKGRRSWHKPIADARLAQARMKARERQQRRRSQQAVHKLSTILPSRPEHE